jgi:hypothetical protein
MRVHEVDHELAATDATIRVDVLDGPGNTVDTTLEQLGAKGLSTSATWAM